MFFFLPFFLVNKRETSFPLIWCSHMLSKSRNISSFWTRFRNVSQRALCRFWYRMLEKLDWNVWPIVQSPPTITHGPWSWSKLHMQAKKRNERIWEPRKQLILYFFLVNDIVRAKITWCRLQMQARVKRISQTEISKWQLERNPGTWWSSQFNKMCWKEFRDRESMERINIKELLQLLITYYCLLIKWVLQEKKI